LSHATVTAFREWGQRELLVSLRDKVVSLENERMLHKPQGKTQEQLQQQPKTQETCTKAFSSGAQVSTVGVHD